MHNALENAFTELKRTGKSLEDLRHWLSTHPEMFEGIRQTVPSEKLTVGVTMVDDTVCITLDEYDELHVEVSLTYNQKSHLNPLLASLIDGTAPTETPFAINYKLALPLKDWPLATAHAVARFVARNGLADDRAFMQRVARKLNHHMASQFPGFTLEKLMTLKKSDMLVMTDHPDINSYRQAVETAILSILGGPQVGLHETPLPCDFSADMRQ